MPKHNRRRQDEVSDSSSLPVVNITTADASLLDPDSHIVLISQFWDWAILECYVFDGTQHERRILVSVNYVLETLMMGTWCVPFLCLLL